VTRQSVNATRAVFRILAIAAAVGASVYAYKETSSWWLVMFVAFMALYAVGRVIPDLMTEPEKGRRALFFGIPLLVAVAGLIVAFSLWGEWWLAVVVGFAVGAIGWLISLSSFPRIADEEQRDSLERIGWPVAQTMPGPPAPARDPGLEELLRAVADAGITLTPEEQRQLTSAHAARDHYEIARMLEKKTRRVPSYRREQNPVTSERIIQRRKESVDEVDSGTSRSGLREVVEAYGRALGREAHVLAGQPELTFQQLHNRLQWEGAVVEERLAPERERRSGPGERPWFRALTRFPESEALVRTLVGHSSAVVDCAISPDGTRILSASADNSLRVWDAQSGMELATFQGCDPVAWTPDGTRISSGSSGRRVSRGLHVWDVKSGVEVATLGERHGFVQAFAWSPDGSCVVISVDRGTGYYASHFGVWDAETGAQVTVLGEHDSQVKACAWSPDGTRIVSASADDTVRIWDPETGAEVAARGYPALYPLRRICAWSPDGTRIAWPHGLSELMLYSADNGAELAILGGHDRGLNGCAWSPDGTRIVSASDDYTLKVWGAETGAELATLLGHTGNVNACAWSPDGAWIVSASDDETLKVWDAAVGDAPAPAAAHINCVNGYAFSPDGTRIVSASGDYTLKIWDAQSGDELATLSGHDSAVESCAWSPDGTRIVSVGDDSTLRIWESEAGAELALRSHRRPSARHTCAWSPDGTRIVAAGLRWAPPDPFAEAEPPKAWTHNVWDPMSGARLATFIAHSGEVLSCAWSPDGTRMLSASKDHSLRVINEFGDELAALASHTDSVTACAWSPDGTRIVSASDDGTLKIWDATTWAEFATLNPHTGPVSACAWTADGRLIISGGMRRYPLYGGSLQVWAVDTGSEVARLDFPSQLLSITAHPWLPQVGCGDELGFLWRVELRGIEQRPIVVTAIEHDHTLVIRCPACWREYEVGPDQLDLEITCLSAGCELRLSINPFVIRLARRRAVLPAARATDLRRWLSRWHRRTRFGSS
jgi:WD40 repeat protein